MFVFRLMSPVMGTAPYHAIGRCELKIIIVTPGDLLFSPKIARTTTHE